MAIFLQDGKYRIEKSLGQGGFGITYLATQVNLNRQVAIKEFYPKDFCDTSQVRLTPKPGDEELVARLKRKFISEARNVAKLDHPNIVKIYDVFEENSTAYFVMEYVEGESLDAMSKRGAMSEADALHYIIPIARALEYVHSENMTHLDVKPANIMVRRKNNTPVLIDFGLAKQYDRTTGGETSTSFVGLSPGYAPIEQYNQGGVNTFSPQIDVYALGATLYRLVTGTTPPEPTMRDGNDVEISAPVSAGMRNAIQHAMRMFKSNRTPSMTAFIAELSATPTPTPVTQLQTQILHPQPIEDEEDEEEESNFGRYIKLAIVAVVVIGFIIFLLNRCNRYAPHEDITETETITEEDSAIAIDQAPMEVPVSTITLEAVPFKQDAQIINMYFSPDGLTIKSADNKKQLYKTALVFGTTLGEDVNILPSNRIVKYVVDRVDKTKVLIFFGKRFDDTDNIVICFTNIKKERLRVVIPIAKERNSVVSKTATEDHNDVRVHKNEVIVEEKKPENEKIYSSVDQMPQYPGGDAELMKYLSSHIQYPAMAIENNVQGRVMVQFVVTKTGAIGEVKVVRGVDRDLDKEAIRVVKSLPNFIPGKIEGKAVNVWYTLPVTFKLQGAN
ncbi:MAG: TonB family protein [Muribaculaceae bacterium]